MTYNKMKNLGKTIAITGHRPNKLGNDYSFKSDLSKAIIKELQALIDKLKPECIMSGMALGIDTMWAVLAIKNNIPLIAAIPCRGHSSQWPPQSVKLYNRLINDPLCTQVLVTDSDYTPQCMQTRNEFMVDNSDELIAVWDGTPGGTGNCVRYANGKILLHRIDPTKLK